MSKKAFEKNSHDSKFENLNMKKLSSGDIETRLLEIKTFPLGLYMNGLINFFDLTNEYYMVFLPGCLVPIACEFFRKLKSSKFVNYRRWMQVKVQLF